MGKHSKKEDLEFWAEDSAPRRTERRKAGKTAGKKEPVQLLGNKTVKYPPGRRSGKQPSHSWWAAPIIAVSGGILFVLVAFFAFSCVGYGQFKAMRSAVAIDTFYPGITVEGQDMSSKTLQQALNEFGDRDSSARASYRVLVKIGEDSWMLTADDAGYISDYDSIIKSAWAVGRYGTLSQRYEVAKRTEGAWARDYEVSSGANQARLSERLDAIATAASEPGTAAQISGFDAESRGFAFVEGTEGLAVDARELKDAVMQAIDQGGGEVTVERRTVQPAQTAEALKKTFGLVASAKTNASSSSSNRLTNLKLACQTLNGLRIEPGETFSYNETLGKRTTEKGYKKAPAVSGGAHTMQIGGGICQVSTTLFNAVAKAGLEIVKRHPHTIPSTYVARGLDATVNWPNQDFQFKNTSDYPIYLVAGLNKSKQVIVEVHGKKLDEGVSIKLKGETNSRSSAGEPKYVKVADLPTGETRVVESKRSGYVVTTYRIYYQGDKEVGRERLFKSTYPASGGIVEIGK